MGTIVSAECTNCDFVQEHMFLDSGMLNYKTESKYPYCCNICDTLFVGNVMNHTQLTCPTCGNNDITPYFYAEKEIISLSVFKNKYKLPVKYVLSAKVNKSIVNRRLPDDDVVLHLNKVGICPKCHKNTLEFHFAGMWD